MKNTRKSITPLLGSIAALLLASAVAPRAQAVNIWDGGGADNNWLTAANWDGPDTLPSFLIPLDFSGAIRLAPVNNNPANTIMNGILFDGGAGAFTLSGALINLASNGVVNNSANNQIVNIALTLSGANTFNANTANLTFNNPIILGGNVLTLNGAKTIAITSTIDAVATVGSLVVNGSGLNDGVGTVAISGGTNNLFTGGVLVNNGLVTVAGAATTLLGTGTLTIGDGTGAQGTAIVRNLNFSVLNDAQSLLIASDGRYDLNGNSEIVGNIASTGAAQNLSQIFLGAGFATLSTGNATNTAFQGIISGTGTVTKTGTGVWTLTGANTWIGTTNVNNGTLAIGDVNSGGGSGSTVASVGTGNINVAAIGTLRVDLSAGQVLANNVVLTAGSIVNSTPAAFQTLGGVISGAGTFNQNGPGLTILTKTNTFTGPVNVLAGSLSVGNASQLPLLANNFATAGAVGNLVTVSTGATLFVDLQRNETFGNAVVLNGTGTLIATSPKAQTISGLISGTGTFNQNDNFSLPLVPNTGATTLANVGNTYSGGTLINSGTLNVNATSAAVGGGAPAAGPIGTGMLTINGGGIGTSTGGVGANHAIGNLVTVNGSFAVSNTRDPVGTPLVAAPPAGVPNNAIGTSVINSIAGGLFSDGLTLTNTVTLTAPVTITTNSGYLDFSGAIVGTGGLTFAGNTFTYIGSSSIVGLGATLIAGQFDPNNTYTGLTVVNGSAGGTLLLLGKNSGARAIPGNLQVDAGATVRFDSFAPPNFPGFGTTANQIATTANALVNGTLDLSGLNQTLNNLAGTGKVQLDDLNGANIGTAAILTLNSGNFTGSIFDNNKGGQLVKNSSGTLVLSAVNNYIGNTTINAGTLQVDGFIGSKNTFVNLLGTLSGNGTVGGNVFNSGVVSPGHSPGKLTVKGNYTQTAAGTLLIEVAGRNAGQFDVLAVGGKANLAGTVRILNTGKVRLHFGQTVTFLTATGGVAGKFGTEAVAGFGDGTLTQAVVKYNSNSVQLSTKLGSFSTGIGGLTENQKAVAKQLDKANNSGQSKGLLTFLATEQVGKLHGDLDKLAPEELASVFNIGISLANVQSANLERRMGDIQAGSAGFSAAGYSMGGSGPSYSGDANYNSGATSYRGPAGQGGKEMRAPGEPIPVGVFITGVGEFTNIGNTANAQGYDLTTGGFTLGVDLKLTPHFAIGISAGYARTGADLTNNGRVTVDGAKGSIYATYFTDSGFYVDGAVGGGYNNYDTRRTVLKGTAQGSTSGGEFNALLAAGYNWKSGDLNIGPTANVQYTNVSVNSFRERGSLAPLNIGSQSGDSLRSSLGFKASYDIHPVASGVVIRPEIRAAWQHEFGDSSFALDSRFANGAGNTFTVRGPQIGDDSLLVGAGVAVLWNERTSTYVYYDGELLRSNYSSNNVSGGVRMSF